MESSPRSSSERSKKNQKGGDRSASRAAEASNLELIFGGCIALLGLSGILAFSISGLFMGIGGLCIGAMLVVRAMQWKQIDALAKKYVVYLTKNPKASVYDLAASMRADPRTIKEQFALFAKRGMLVDVVIDEQSGEIIKGLDDSVSDVNPAHEGLIEVECQGCGARKMVQPGSRASCDHCGSELLG